MFSGIVDTTHQPICFQSCSTRGPSCVIRFTKLLSFVPNASISSTNSRTGHFALRLLEERFDILSVSQRIGRPDSQLKHTNTSSRTLRQSLPPGTFFPFHAGHEAGCRF